MDLNSYGNEIQNYGNEIAMNEMFCVCVCVCVCRAWEFKLW